MKSGGHHAHDAAWRQAVQQWLIDNRVIALLQPKTLSPHSS
jgi:hypothetical protein